ncbi:MAG TPA: 2OG-Fe(II) oxygenase [Stellaceae bacterium]|jgi:hypothetical protein|nr:2OG-Fe(II) oxygenase [Stellaceae bacterium]
MIAASIISQAENYRNAFQSARPFKHVCIDEFFTNEAAEASLRDFPAFDREFARNEFGEYGRKAVVSNIREISPFYAGLYDYLMSPQLMSAMSDITGIPGLHGDPKLYGGGTHENLDGQELDVHIDFNFQLEGGFHRRANLLLYLNKEWDPAWGGAIELHSNPRRPELDKFEQFNVIFNRAVIFETNEHSWHGFRQIKLPRSRQYISRKCLSIYLYTKERPAHEIAGPHGTFYIPWPFPGEIGPGRVLSAGDVDELCKGYARRDRQIEMYQNMEERLGRDLEQLQHYLNEVLDAIRAPIVGYALQVGTSSGLFHDGWVTRNVKLQLRAERVIAGFTIKGFIPDHFPALNRTLEVEIDGQKFVFALPNGGFAFGCPKPIDAGSLFDLALRCDADFNASEAGAGGDRRSLAYHLDAIELSHDLPDCPASG